MPANSTLVADYRNASQVPKTEAGTLAFFEPLDSSAIPAFKHKETDYADFKNVHLVPHKFSQNGPGLAVGDVNGDGLEDFFAGGAAIQSGQLFLAKGDGTFAGQPLVTGQKPEEDMGSLFFDADNALPM